MDIPEQFEPVIKELLQQLIDFEKSYGRLPKVQLVVSDEYNKLVELVKSR